MIKYKIALIYGGRGLEHGVSLSGAEYAYRLIDRDIFDVIPIYIKKSGEWVISKEKSAEKLPNFKAVNTECLTVFPAMKNNSGGLLTDEGFIEISVAFPLLHGDFGEDGTVQGALENAKIPYIGTDIYAGSLCCDKVYTKIMAESLGIPVAKWILSDKSSASGAREEAEKSLSYPMFIKPARLGSSFGTSAVRSGEDFAAAYEKAFRVGKRVLIEEKISVKAELECGLFSSKSKVLFTKLGDISCHGEFYDYRTKYESTTIASVNADSVFEKTHGDKLRLYSKKLASLIGITGISRFDFFLSEDGEILFNEINTMPGFTEGSLYPRLLEASGVSVKDALCELLSEKAGKP